MKFEGVNNGMPVVRFLLKRDEFFTLVHMANRDGLTPGKEAQSIMRAVLVDDSRRDANGGDGTEAARTPEVGEMPEAANAPGEESPRAGEDGSEAANAPGIESPEYWFPKLTVEDWNHILQLAYWANTTPAQMIHRILSHTLPVALQVMQAYEAQGEALEGWEDGEDGEASETTCEPGGKKVE